MAGSTVRRLWTIADVVMLLLFLFSVVVQVNDPDPLTWMIVYGLAAAACILSLRQSRRWWFPTAVGGLALAWASTIAPRVIGQVRFLDMFGALEMKNLGIEESREMYGLVLVALWMAVLAIRATRRPVPTAGHAGRS